MSMRKGLVRRRLSTNSLKVGLVLVCPEGTMLSAIGRYLRLYLQRNKCQTVCSNIVNLFCPSGCLAFWVMNATTYRKIYWRCSDPNFVGVYFWFFNHAYLKLKGLYKVHVGKQYFVAF